MQEESGPVQEDALPDDLITYTLLTANGAEVDEVKQIGETLEQVLRSSIVDIPVQSVSVYDIPNFWECAYPHLFPYGTGGYNTPRRVKLTPAQHDEYLMKYCDERFAQDIPFLFARYMHRMSLSSGSIAFVADKFRGAHTAHDDIELDSDMLRRVQQSAAKGKDRQQCDQVVERILERLKHFASCMPGSSMSMVQERNELFARYHVIAVLCQFCSCLPLVHHATDKEVMCLM
jgi:hypothetical protein